MDQFASALSRAGHALLIDCRSAAVEHVPWPNPDYVVLIIDSGISRELASGAYEERVRQCAEAVRIMNRDSREIESLRDATMEELESNRGRMPDVIFRRARHVISEIARTHQAAAALRDGNLPLFGRLMNQSHDSLRNDYEVSLPQLDRLVQRVREVPGVVGARLTGAGFGGCAVAIAKRTSVDAVRHHLTRGGDATTPAAPRVLQTELAAGAEVSRLERSSTMATP
jgi:galactokinase